MKNNAKKAKTATSVSITVTQEQGPASVDNSGMYQLVLSQSSIFFLNNKYIH